ncbi:MAG: hypothetical protein AAFQ85_03725 [Pseudomonadota bacterium]
MRNKYYTFGSAAVGALTLAACAAWMPGDDAATEAETTDAPFIDPVILSQNRCGGAPIQPPQPTQDMTADAASFDFADAFPLPEDVVAHFTYAVSTSSEDAQRWFDTGLAHMANFNHDEAIAAFRAAQAADPACAMCYWGEGLSFGSNINAPFNPARGAAGLAAAEQAFARIESASAPEAALIEALMARYAATDDGMVETADRYADAMNLVARAYPSDKMILALAAEANLNTQPWDYWQPGAREPKGRTARTIELLESALDIDPEFAPSIHLYIHATEASVDPYRAESYADTLAGQSLGVGHLVHMPSHIYLKLGHWKKSHDSNIAAIADDEAYIAESENAAAYAAVYYPHNVHFVVANAQLGGDGDTAQEMSDKLDAIVDLDPDMAVPFGEHIAAAPVFTALQFGDHDAILARDEPAEAHLFSRTVWHYARGAVLTDQGDMDGAKAELDALAGLQDADMATYDAYGVPVAGIMDVAHLTLEGRMLAAEGDMDQAVDKLDAAADKHEQLSYMEPTWWYYPTRQTLAAYLLRNGQADRAEREFFRTLLNSPNNAYALYGLAEAYKAQGDARSETHARHLFSEAWIGNPEETPELTKL